MSRFLPFALGLIVTALVIPAQGGNPDRLKWQNIEAWRCAQAVVLKPFPLAGPFEGEYSLSFYTEIFRTRLTTSLHGAGLTVTSEPTPATDPNRTIVIEGEFLELDMGSRACRYWIGFGAGRSKCKVRMRARLLADGSEVFTLTHGRLSAFGLKHDELQENIMEVAEDIEKGLVAELGKCKEPPSVQTTDWAAPVPDQPRGDIYAPPDTSGDASILVLSVPDNAEVYADDHFVGNTPIRLIRPLGAEIRIRVEKFGCQTWERKLLIENREVRVSAELQRARTTFQKLSMLVPPDPHCPHPGWIHASS